MKRKSGFTIVESLVVLMITVIILGLGLFVKDVFNPHRVSHFYFWNEFKNQFELAEDLSQQNHCVTEVEVIPYRKVIFTSGPLKNGRDRVKILRMPQGLSPQKGKTIRINAKGHVSPATIKWNDEDNHEVISQKFELGWGIYRLEKDQ